MDVLVEQGGALFRGFQHVHHRQQHLIVDVDERKCLLRDVRCTGRHGGDSVTDIEHLVAGQGIVAQVLEIHRAFAQSGGAILCLSEVVGGHYGIDAGQRLGAAGVDGADPGVGVRAAQDLAVQEARQVHVGAKLRAAGGLVCGVIPGWSGADDSVWLGRIGLFHSLTSSHATVSCCATACTARTILS